MRNVTLEPAKTCNVPLLHNECLKNALKTWRPRRSVIGDMGPNENPKMDNMDIAYKYPYPYEHLHRAGLFAIFGHMITFLAIGRKTSHPPRNANLYIYESNSIARDSDRTKNVSPTAKF
jgi:hypothetical protein